MHLADLTVAALNPLDARSLLSGAGALGVFLVLFAETGLLVGFFLPGDSLLFTAGLLCATGSSSALHLSLPAVLAAAAGGALLGAQVGYLIGRRLGPSLLDRPDRPRLHEGVQRARAALDRYGPGKAVVLARFIPVVRTVLNPLAGTLAVPVRTLAGGRRAGLVARPDAGRLRPGLAHPRRRPLPAAHRGGHRRRVAGPGGPRAVAGPPPLSR
jgi:membrane-associated protein